MSETGQNRKEKKKETKIALSKESNQKKAPSFGEILTKISKVKPPKK